MPVYVSLVFWYQSILVLFMYLIPMSQSYMISIITAKLEIKKMKCVIMNIKKILNTCNSSLRGLNLVSCMELCFSISNVFLNAAEFIYFIPIDLLTESACIYCIQCFHFISFEKEMKCVPLDDIL